MAAKKRAKRAKSPKQPRAAPPLAKRGSAAHDPAESKTPAPAAERAAVEPAGPGPPVAGMGASAGGLDAFKKFFTAMPADSGIALVLIPHLDPTHESLMAELLGRHTRMPVVEATEGDQVQANHVYIIPPNKYMTIKDGVLRLTGPVERYHTQTSIDLFLRSLAEDQQEKAICIILSGTGSHGTLGLRAVKANGGMAIVQEPNTAAYDRMPQSAIATGLADYILPVEQMPEALIKYVQHYHFNGGPKAGEVAEVPDHLNQVLALLRTRSRFDFRYYRKKMLTRRLERRMGLNHFDQIADYLEFLRSHPGEVKQLAKDLLISVTSFFREPEAFRALETEVIAPLVKAAEPDSALRVWVPGCATGEEPYSIAMLLFERLAAAEKRCRLQIFATDVDEDALEAARLGKYPESIAADLTPDRLARFFTAVDESTFQVNSHLREAVTFAVQNQISDPPFSKMDLVSCRNLLIYLEPEVQKRLIPLMHFALNAGGYLFLGPSETIGRQVDLFEPVSRKWRIYRRIGPTRLDRVEFPFATRTTQPGQTRRPPEPSEAGLGRVAELAQRVLLEQFAPAAVLINRKCEILYFFGPTSNFLDMPTGEPTQDLRMMTRDGLRTKLRAACQKAIDDAVPVTVVDAQVRREGRYVPVVMTVKPLQSPRTAEGLLLVTFRDSAESAPPARASELVGDDSLVHQLENELRATREDLQSTIEEVESSNEELKGSNEEVMSMNEELQSANEELETSKEELQSLNEELTTVNNQLQEKVEELEVANDDMANLLNSSDVASVFLGTDFRIRRYTPASGRLLNLIATDIGRPVTDIALKFYDVNLVNDAKEVLGDLVPCETEVRSEEDRWYLRRILPYRTVENRIEGVVVTFSDVTGVKQASEQSRLLATVLTNSSDAVAIHDFAGRITAWNRGAEHMFGYTEAEALQMDIAQLNPEKLRAEQRSVWERVRRGEEVDSRETRRLRKDGGILDVLVTATPLTDESGRPIAIAETTRDITELRRARLHLEQQVQQRTAALREQQERLHAVLNAPDDAIITIDQHGTIESVNSAAESMFGYPPAEMVGQNVSMLMPSPYREEHDRYLANYLRTGVRKMIGIGREVTARRRDGSTFPVDLAVSKVGSLDLFTGIVRDISRRKELEREVVEIATTEQRRIGQALHDQVGQELTALGLLASSLVESLRENSPADMDIAKKVGEGLARVFGQVRDISRGLVPVEVDALGLTAALARLAAQMSELSGARCSFSSEGSIALDDNTTATHLYYITCEACINAIRHGQVSSVEISLRATDDLIVLQIRDDGVGITDQAKAARGLGMRLMRNRASVIEASLSVEPAAPRGVVVTCTIHKENQHGPEQVQPRPSGTPGLDRG